MSLNKLSLFLVVLFLAGCSSATRKAQKALRESFAQGQYDSALEIVNNQKMMGGDENQLLRGLEKGLIYFQKGSYAQAIEILNQSKKLAEQLYTTSVTKATSSFFVNDYSQNYYGPLYERSMINAYLVLSHLMVFKLGKIPGYEFKNEKGEKINRPEVILTSKERWKHWQMARSHVIYWDASLKSFAPNRLGKRVYKNDLWAKILGAYVHENSGRRTDGQVALQLYKDAQKLLLVNYNNYESFNVKFKSFQDYFPKLQNQSLTWIKNNLVLEAPAQKELQDFLIEKILTLTRRLRPYDLNAEAKRLGADKALVDRLKKLKPQLENISVVVESGLISPKKPEKYNVSLRGALESSDSPAVKSLITQVGAPLLMHFAGKVLKLTPKPGTHTATQALVGSTMSSVSAYEAGIEFELPQVEKQLSAGAMKIIVKDLEGKVMATHPVVLVAPLSDIAQEAVDYHSKNVYLKTGLRLATKHAAALATSYVTYKSLKGNEDDNFLARTAAIAQYLLLAKGIAASEQADTRFWSTLPNSIRMANFYLPAGEYKLELIFDKRMVGQSLRQFDLGTLKVDKDPQLVHYRHF